MPRRLRLQGQHLRRDLLHGDRLPRLPRAHRHDLPARLPDPRDARPLHAEAAFRLRGAAWYWHFVDVVWLFLFVAIYVWGSNWGAAAAAAGRTDARQHFPDRAALGPPFSFLRPAAGVPAMRPSPACGTAPARPPRPLPSAGLRCGARVAARGLCSRASSTLRPACTHAGSTMASPIRRRAGGVHHVHRGVPGGRRRAFRRDGLRAADLGARGDLAPADRAPLPRICCDR